MIILSQFPQNIRKENVMEALIVETLLLTLSIIKHKVLLSRMYRNILEASNIYIT